MTGVSRTLLSALLKRVESTPDTVAFTFDSDGRSESVTFGQLHDRALGVRSQLRNACGQGDRALLVYAPSVDYVVAFYGCLMAGVIAVPVYPPSGSRFEAATEKIAAIGRDCDPAVVLTVREIADAKDHLAHLVGSLSDVSWVATDHQTDGIRDRGQVADVTEYDVALLQYSSGSTGDPKGVVLRHRNLADNLEIIGEKFGLRVDDSAVIWLPPYHDMGLIGGVLAPIWHGLTVHLSSPFDFLKDPGSWLRKISETGATASGGPNFAYELCARRMTDSETSELDLSRWRIAFTGAEPIRPSTLDRFSERFSSNGFDRRSWYPCYGLAEATLLVAGGRPGDGAVTTTFDADGLKIGRATPANGGQELVSCGTPHPAQRLQIVKAGSVDILGPGQVGEILVSGISADTSYWSGEALADVNWPTVQGDRYLRTGDLGFLHGNQLYVTGRVKDVIIRAGRNYYPQDLELLAEAVDGVRPGASAAIETLVGGDTVVTVAAELSDADLSADLQLAVATEISERCLRGAGLAVARVLLLPRNTILKTSSGKIRRQPTAAAIDGGQIAGLFDSASDTQVAHTSQEEDVAAGQVRSGTGVNSETSPARVHAAVVMALADAGVLIPAEGQRVDMDSLQALTVAHQIGRKYPPGPDLAVLLSGCRLEQITASVVGRKPDNRGPSAPDLLSERGLDIEADGRQSIPCTPNQTALLQSVLMGDDAAVGILARAIHSTVAWDVEKLRSALAALVAEQPALQVGIEETASGDYVQVLSLGVPAIRLDEFDFSELAPEHWLANISEWAHAPFDLSRAPLLRAAHIRVDDGFALVIAIHHVVADHTSVVGALTQLLEPAPMAQSPAVPLGDRRNQYAQFCAEQEIAVSQADRHALPHAVTRLAPTSPPYDFPLANPSSARGVINGDLSELASAVCSTARELDTTPFVVWLSLLQGCLLRLSRQDGITLGVPLVHRPNGDDILGYAVHPQVVRADIDSTTTLVTLVSENKLEQIQMLSRGPVGIAGLAANVGGTRAPGRNPLFDILFTYQGWDGGSDSPQIITERSGALGSNRTLNTLPMSRGTTGSPLNCVLSASDGTAHLRVEFDGVVASREFATCLLLTLRTFAAEALADIHSSLTSLRLTASTEIGNVPGQGRGPDNSAKAGVVHAVGAIAASIPEQTAIRTGRSPDVSFGWLWDASGRVAAALQDQGVTRGQRVGAHLTRTPEMVAALLGIMRAGAAYVPLDPNYPDMRTRQVVDASGLSLVLSDMGPSPHGKFEHVDTLLLSQALTFEPLSDGPGPDATETAYVLFTSGSTGVPKGVEITHENVANLVTWASEEFGLASEVVLASTSICFDLSVFEIFATLAAGGEIGLVENATDAIGRLGELGVTLINTVPSAVDGLLGGAIPAEVQTICLAGEPLPPQLVDRIAEHCSPGTRVYNLYGPSETTTYSTFDEVVAGGAVTIGRPVANTQVKCPR